MGYVGIRNLDAILNFESIGKKKISSRDFEFLKQQATINNVFLIEFCSPAEFTKPMCFFINKPHEFTFVREGHLLSYSELNQTSSEGNKYFLAYKIDGQKMFIHGYFPGELD